MKIDHTKRVAYRRLIQIIQTAVVDDKVDNTFHRLSNTIRRHSRLDASSSRQSFTGELERQSRISELAVDIERMMDDISGFIASKTESAEVPPSETPIGSSGPGTWKRRLRQLKKDVATIRDHGCWESINRYKTILAHSLNTDNAIDWSTLLADAPFRQPTPTEPMPVRVPAEPERSDLKYSPRRPLLAWLWLSEEQLKDKEERSRLQKARQFRTDHELWETKRRAIEQENRERSEAYLDDLRRWREAKREHVAALATFNQAVLDRKKRYEERDREAVIDYCEMVLTNSEYPATMPNEWSMDYQHETRLMIVDYALPNIEALPAIKNVRYVASRDVFVETPLSERELNSLYDGVLYQIALRTIHELYDADVANALNTIVFNGWVDSTSKATGRNVTLCIMSLQASKEEFSSIALKNVDPKECFKHLKGVGSSRLHGLSAIAPIITISREDPRFTSSYEVVREIDESDNLAAMDWRDFENLIRELFEREFQASGGEVKITQSSRDGGVDAVAFDPDPIRGGKIVIQAKRYTNVVGVSAVRDLFGTVLNEGATKGILVTTADYGGDAYKFAKGKPLTLMNGSNLLHLLRKHGQRARIDLKEAKQVLS